MRRNSRLDLVRFRVMIVVLAMVVPASVTAESTDWQSQHDRLDYPPARLEFCRKPLGPGVAAALPRAPGGHALLMKSSPAR